MKEAVEKLMKIPMIMSTQTLDIKDVKLPFMLVCPSNQYNATKVNTFQDISSHTFKSTQ